MKRITTNEAAKHLQCSPITIRQAVREGRLTGKKFGRDWMVVKDKKFNNFKLSKAGRPSKRSI